MLYNVVLVSAVQQRESVISTHISSLLYLPPLPIPLYFPIFLQAPFHQRPKCPYPISKYVCFFEASLVAQMVKRLPTMRETWVLSLGREDPLEKEMATHSSIHAWKIPWTEEPGGLQFMGSQESDMTERLHFHFHFPVTSLPKRSLTPCHPPHKFCL